MEIDSMLPLSGQVTLQTDNTPADVVSSTVYIPKIMSNTNYRVSLNFCNASYPTKFDGNYDVELICSDKTTESFVVTIMRGTSAFLKINGTWYVDWIVVPN